MEAIEIKRTQFSVSDFLAWQKQGTLSLNPPFQRRSVWSAGARSYLIDTVVRGLPTPLIFLRDQIDLDTLEQHREVIDGQQRLRTLIGFVEESALPGFTPDRDRTLVLPEHNPVIAGRRFGQLDKDVRNRILKYEFSTHVLPSSTEDRDVLMIFARLNSTGTPLNPQELRNAEFFGLFKTSMYQLAYEQLENWLGWGVFTDDQIARMLEVEMASDLVVNMIDGISGKSQVSLRKQYRKYDTTYPWSEVVAERFRSVMGAIDELVGDVIKTTAFSSQVFFFTLFSMFYDEMYGLGSELGPRAPSRISKSVQEPLMRTSRRLRNEDVPEQVLDAVHRASADLGRRRTRLEFLERECRIGATFRHR